MSLFDAITAAGGLAFFLYGMTNMGKSLEKLGGGKLEKTLQTVTGSLWKSILFGAIVTACIQSSSATTVIVVGLVPLYRDPPCFYFTGRIENPSLYQNGYR